MGDDQVLVLGYNVQNWAGIDFVRTMSPRSFEDLLLTSSQSSLSHKRDDHVGRSKWIVCSMVVIDQGIA